VFIKIKIYKEVMWPVVLYGCETWSLKLREELDNRVLRKILGPNWNEITRQWRRIHKEEHHDLHCCTAHAI
jgi:hypothetical protein